MNLKDKGVELVFIKAKKGFVNISDIEEAITSKTKMIFCSLVEFISGYKNDMLEIGALCKKNKVLFCVDASHGLGAMPIDVTACQIDFLLSLILRIDSIVNLFSKFNCHVFINANF